MGDNITLSPAQLQTLIDAAVAAAIASQPVKAAAASPFDVVATAPKGEKQAALRVYNAEHKVAGKYCPGNGKDIAAHGFAYSKATCPTHGFAVPQE